MKFKIIPQHFLARYFIPNNEDDCLNQIIKIIHYEYAENDGKK